ncbi:MAG: hypothetical protein HY023_14800 [Chloroflexi bacterium]|nr:hypothetical protein [Chloroflexota bacterium]MBI3763387.1 hypothetical protein [Chloroflexota bacterium]
MEEKPTRKPGVMRLSWQIVKVIVGVIIWLGLMLLTYYSLYAIPAVVLVSFWLIVVIYQMARPPVRTKRTFRPEEDEPRRAIAPGEIDVERIAK